MRQKKEYRQALHALEKALNITQRFPLLWTFKGFANEHKMLADIYYQEALCYLELNDQETALGALDDALKIEIDPDALYQRALVLEYLGNLQGAENDLKMAIEKSIEPAKKELALHNRADYFLRQSHKDLAIIDYKAGIAQFECAQAYCELGRLALQENLYDQAIEYFSKSINKEETVNALRLRALTHTKLEEWKEAETDLDKALKLEPQNALAKIERQNVHKVLESQKAK